MAREQDENYSADEIARRRDEVVRRMANTPPQPKKASSPRLGKKKSSASGRANHKNANPNGKT